MPRVAHVISTPEGIGGAERVVAQLLEGGDSRGWEQRVINPFATDPAQSALRSIAGVPQYRGRRGSSLKNLPATLLWLRRELHGFKPDVVHAHLFHAEVSTAVAGAGSRAWTVLTHHHGDHFTHERPSASLHLDRWAGRRYDRVVAISSWVEQFLLTRYRYSAEKVVCIPNGWSGQPNVACGLASRPTIICVGGFRQEKGHPDLLSAYVEVAEAMPDSNLVLVGDGTTRPALENEVERLGLRANVEFRGAVDDVWPHLAEAHVFALSSRNEGLGLAALEAMASGLPVVASNVGGIPEIVANGKTGVLVQPGRPHEMAGAILQLLRDASLRKRMGEAARKLAESRTATAAVGRYFELYKEGLRKPKQASETRHAPA